MFRIKKTLICAKLYSANVIKTSEVTSRKTVRLLRHPKFLCTKKTGHKLTENHRRI